MFSMSSPEQTAGAMRLGLTTSRGWIVAPWMPGTSPGKSERRSGGNVYLFLDASLVATPVEDPFLLSRFSCVQCTTQLAQARKNGGRE
jgi:hypothetical protein